MLSIIAFINIVNKQAAVNSTLKSEDWYNIDIKIVI